MKHLPVFTAALGLLALSCASAPVERPPEVPAWVRDREAVYPEQSYLVFIGSGPDLAGAKNDALTQMSGYFGLSVKTLSTGTSSYKEEVMGGRSSFERSIDSKIQTSTDVKLFALEWGPSFATHAEVRIPVFLNRRQASRIWDMEIANTAAQYYGYLRRAEDKASPISFRVAAFKAAQSLGVQLEALQRNWKLIASPGMELSPQSAAAGVDKSLMSDLSLEVLSGGAIVVFTFDGDQAGLAPVVSDRLSKAGLVTGSSGLLRLPLKSTVSVSPGSYGTFNAEWSLDLALEDGSQAVFNFHIEGRSGGSSEATAKRKAQADLTKELDSRFIPQLIEKFLSLI